MRELESSRRDNTDMRVRNLVNTQVNNPFFWRQQVIINHCQGMLKDNPIYLNSQSLAKQN